MSAPPPRRPSEATPSPPTMTSNPFVSEKAPKRLRGKIHVVTPTSSTVTFTVPGEPMSKARARVVNGHAYTPAATVTAETSIRRAYLRNIGKKPRQGPLAVTIHFDAATRVRRDLDNMAKLCLDALNRRAWVDDSQIQELHLTRSYVAKGAARTTITITELP